MANPEQRASITDRIVPRPHETDIAVIGMACRFPGAENYHQFWNNLAAGINSVAEIPKERWDWQAYWGDAQTEKNKTNSRWGGFIEDVDKFDPLFFNIAPKEANYIDPQHRVALQAVWHAIEDAGYSASALSGQNIGVYMGASKNDYAELMRAEQQEIVSFVSTGTVHSILANRISYLLNFRGKSETIDTACASSLVALHNAIRDIQLGECNAALVGGVNALITPTMYISHAKSGMLSPDGSCKTFDAKANGYVRGEGVGVVFIKSLAQALADQDHIVGVIKGSAVNHGGRAGSLTAPNVNAQAEVIQAAMRNAQVTPDTITYVEAHGTATPLGDPVEITGLTKAFQTFADSESLNPATCGVGSVKTNIGHLESAAGIAGLIKVFLCLKHGQLPPLVHFEQLNPYIELEETPFFVVNELMDWSQLVKEGKELPRRAGLSSFGMGGVNAHLIVEEAPRVTREPSIPSARRPQLIPLSAKTEAALVNYATELSQFLEAEGTTSGHRYSLDDIAFTYQTGREEMAHRVLFVADDIRKLIILLKRFIDKEPDEQILCGQVTMQGAERPPMSTSDPIEAAARWVRGHKVDWHSLSAGRGFRVPLPVYPFEKRRCWFAELTEKSDTLPNATRPNHPDPASTLVEYTVSLDQADYFLRDHCVRGESILPGVAYFELIRSGIEAQSNRPLQCLKDVHWLAPLVVKGAVEATIVIDNGAVAVQTGQTTHMTGQLDVPAAIAAPQKIDLETIFERCPHSFRVESLYRKFEEYGLIYGDTFRVIEECHYNEHEALCRLVRRQQDASDESPTLESSILDGVFQAVVALNILGDVDYSEQFLPFRLDSVTFHQTIPAVCYAYVYKEPDVKDPQSLVFGMQLVDEAGNVVAVFHHFVKRPASKQQPETTETELYTYTSSWVHQPLTMHREKLESLLLFDDNITLLSHLETTRMTERIILVKPGNTFAQIAPDIYTVNPTEPKAFRQLFDVLAKRRLNLDSVVYTWNFAPGLEAEAGESPTDESDVRRVIDSLQRGILPLLHLTQSLIAYPTKYQDQLRLFYFYQADQSLHSAIHALCGGFSRTLAYENPQLSIISVGVDRVDAGGTESGSIDAGSTDEAGQALANRVGAELSHYVHAPLQEVVYRDSVRRVRTVVEKPRPWPETAASLLRPNGCYLITGGSGGIGQILARYLAEEYQATIVVIGRSHSSPVLDEKLAAIEELGGRGLYFSADVTEQNALEQVIQTLNERQLWINGVIHAAGLIDDAYILRTTAASFEKVLAPKVYGTVNLDQATQNQPLDFFMVLSSVAALMPNQGQSAYAAANSFLDRFVELRNQWWAAQQRPGVGISINWPLWESGGIGVTEDVKEHLWHVFGMKPLSSETGLSIFDKSLRQPHRPPNGHLITIEGVKQKIDRHLGVVPWQRGENRHQVDSGDAQRQTTVNQRIRALINRVLGQNIAVRSEHVFADLGLDSTEFVALTNHINREFRCALKPTLFFEVQTVQELATYLQNHQLVDAAPAGDAILTSPLAIASLIDKQLNEGGGINPASSDSSVTTYRKTLYNNEFFMRDHVVAGKFNVPGACYIEMGRQAGAISAPDKFVYKLTNNYWAKQLSSSGEPIQMEIRLVKRTDHTDYEISGVEDGIKSVCAVGQLYQCTHPELAEIDLGSFDLEPIKARCGVVRHPQAIYEQIIAEGLHVGPTFQPMTEVFLSADEALAHLKLPETIVATAEDYLIHPTLLTGVLQTALLNNKPDGIDGSQFIPIAIDEILLVKQIPADCYIYTQPVASATHSRGIQKFTAQVVTPTGEVIATLQGIALRLLSAVPQARITPAKPQKAPQVQAVDEPERRLTQIETLLKEITSEGIGLLPSEIDSSASFDSFGISSVMIIDLNQRLAEHFGNLSKTLFFEYKNFRELAQYFDKHHAATLSALLATTLETPNSTASTTAVDQEEPPQATNSSTPTRQVSAALATEPRQPKESIPSVESSSHPPTPSTLESAPDESTQQAGGQRGDIAIIGVAGRYPNADNLSEFWTVLKNGEDCIREIPEDRFDYSSYYDASYHDDSRAINQRENHSLHTKWGSFINGVDQFDPLFFNISPREAELIDPQERLFLQVVWETLEDAGYTRARIATKSNKVGVFVGALWQPYVNLGVEETAKGNVVGPSGLLYSIPNRISYFFDWTGPSLAIDTACSSSLTALHYACESLKQGECTSAIVGGVNLSITASKYLFLSRYGFLSSDGRCRSFGEGGDGYVPGEGIGAVYIKRLADAVEDGDRILAVIKATAVNHGGKTHGYTVPNPTQQGELILGAVEKSGLHPRAISYVEAHGTGTALGDPIEITGLQNAFGQYTDETQFCAIGSVKSNIGHLEAAAGIAGLTKIILQMRHQALVPSIHAEQLNPNIDFETTPFFVQRALDEWQRPYIAMDGQNKEMPRAALLSSFGAGGANAHAVLTEYQPSAISHQPSANTPQVIVLSAKDEERLRVYAEKLGVYLDEFAQPNQIIEVLDERLDIQIIRQSLREMVADILGVGIANLEDDQPFGECGLDAVQLTYLQSMVAEKYSRDLPMTHLDSAESLAGQLFTHLADTVTSHQPPATDNQLPALADVAYTLQVGREAMDERLAFVAFSLEEVAERLRQYQQNEDATGFIYQGGIKDRQQTTRQLIVGEKGRVFVRSVIDDKEYEKLAQLWVSGVEIDWSLLYGDEQPQCISLPTYPFAKERYWIPRAESLMVGHNGNDSNKGETVAQLHPFVHQNISTLSEQRFRTVLTGNEFFLRDHRVQGEKVLPGVVYLEMARAAGELAVEAGSVTQLQDVVWTRPLVVEEEPCEIHLGLYPEERGTIAFEVSSRGEGEPLIHSQGKVVMGEKTFPEPLDIAAIEERCTTRIEGDACYERFASAGLVYGPPFQRIREIQANGQEALASLQSLSGITNSGYGLHPSMMDAALQAVIGLTLVQQSHQVPNLYLPFAVQEVAIYRDVPEEGYAHVGLSAGREPESRALKYDVALTDAKGSICVMLKGFMVRAVASQTEDESLLYGKPQWQPQPLDEEDAESFDLPTANTVFLAGFDGNVVAFIRTNFDQVEIVTLPQPTSDEQKTVDEWLRAGFDTIKGVVESKPQTNHQIVVMVADGIAPYLYAPLVGLLKTAHLEQPKISGKVLSAADSEADRLVSRLRAEMTPANSRRVEEIRYGASGVREVRNLIEITLDTKAHGPYLKPGGVYWITGGLGGLGRIFACHLQEIAQFDEGITLILSGRSMLDAAGEQLLDDLNVDNNTVVYLQGDVSQRDEVEHLVQQIKAKYGQLNGILHGAGVLRDSFILHKTAEEIEAVLAPKVAGTLNLDAATRDEPLDFVVLFSSLAGVLGNVGQADYAAANAFLDAFAHHRQALVEAGERSGRTLAINWPLWAEGGMRVDGETMAWMADELGMTALETADGLAAFERGVVQENLSQLLVTGGSRHKIQRYLSGRAQEESVTRTQSIELSTDEEKELLQASERYLKRVLASALKLPEASLDARMAWERYGFDSILALNLTRRLEQHLGELPKTLFFEYPTLSELTAHFVAAYPAQLRALVGMETQKEVSGSKKETFERKGSATTALPSPRARWLARAAAASGHGQTAANAAADIAIVGLSGRYPMAENLDQFWENLKAGCDAITEIPPERWDHSRYFDADPNRRGKSYSKWGGFIQGVDQFDPLFFNISPREAELMDPQERLFLEVAWQTLEDAGYTRQWIREQLQGRVGVFVGVMWGEYQLYGDGQRSPSASYASIANRVSYFLNLHGPSMAVDTMCSSSLTTIHLACESIRRSECAAALAGGVNVSIHPYKYLYLSQSRFTASDGRCRSFGEGGDGYVPGEGVGAVLLKPLAQAEADGDHIYGVIKGSSVNHGGKTNGYTVPNPNAQHNLIADALRKSGVDAHTISYVEAHGTGTALGDPIEIRGLSQAFAHDSNKDHSCAVGSVKSNIGHLESAAGIAGLTKVLLQMQHQQLVPSIHAEILNPHIDFAATPFVVQRQLSTWEQPVVEVEGVRRTVPRRAGISSFGAGGANAHLIVEEYAAASLITHSAKPDDSQLQVIVLSAKNEERLRAYAHKLLVYLEAFATPKPQTEEFDETPDFQSLLNLLREMVADILSVDVAEIESDQSFEECGFDVMQLSRLQTGVEEQYGLKIAITLGDSMASLIRRLILLWEDRTSCSQAIVSGKQPVAILAPNTVERIQQRPSLADIAYTLQVGREAMEERLAFVVSSIEELTEQLKVYQQNKGVLGKVYQGSIKSGKQTADLLVNDAEGKAYVQAVIAARNYDKLAQLWVAGVEIEWRLLFADRTLQRISLPNYPFERKRYWIGDRKPKDVSGEGTMLPQLRGRQPVSGKLALQPTQTVRFAENIYQNRGPASVSPTVSTPLASDPSSAALSATHHNSEGDDERFTKHIKDASHNEHTTVQSHSNGSGWQLRKQIKTLLADILYLEATVDEGKPFSELGMDSITGVEFSKALNRTLDINLEAIQLYEYPTIETLSAYLAELVHEPRTAVVDESGNSQELDLADRANGVDSREMLLSLFENLSEQKVSISYVNEKLKGLL